MSTEHGGRRFDWVSRHDAKSLNYLVADLLAAKPSAYDKLQNVRLAHLEAAVFPQPPVPVPPIPPPPPPPVPVPPVPPIPVPPAPPVPPTPVLLWPGGPQLDQGQTGMCVGYGWTDLLAAQPNPEQFISGTGDAEGSTADTIYDLAQQLGGQVSDPQSGTSVLDGAKACQQLGHVVSYHWALSVDDIILALKLGPVVIGIPWFSGMMDPDAFGVIHVSGNQVGGHCLVILGYSPAGVLDNSANGYFLLRNSWGDWGPLHGNAYISSPDLVGLLAQQGEAAVALKA